MFKKGVMWLLISSVLGACAPNKHKTFRLSAPQGPSDTGLVAELEDRAAVDIIKKRFPQTEIRPLSPRHNLYEFFGLSEVELKSAVKVRFTTKNTYYMLKPLAMPGDDVQIDGLPRCATATQHPEARIHINGVRASQYAATTITRGETLTISAADSRPHPQRPSKLRTAIVVGAPGFSSVSDKPVIDSDHQFKPDALGAYQIGVLVQDEKLACSLETTYVLVSENAPFQPGQLSKAVDRKFFRHLNDIGAEAAWALSQGEGVTVAIVDSGVNYNHPYLAPNILMNDKERGADGQDNDGNGLVDDELGYDFVNGDGLPFDDDGHGSHVAGLVAAQEIGVAPKAKILAVKTMTSIGGDAGSVAAGVLYAVDRGARVINLSLGSAMSHPLLERAIRYAESKNVIVVAAAGNGDEVLRLGYDIDKSPVYPASLHTANMITVAALDDQGALTTYSNFGATSVDVAAPGGTPKAPLISTALDNPRGQPFVGLFGTSMATPLVSGMVADILAAEPTLTPLDVRFRLLGAGPTDARLEGKVASLRRLRADDALNLNSRQFLGL